MCWVEVCVAFKGVRWLGIGDRVGNNRFFFFLLSCSLRFCWVYSTIGAFFGWSC